MKKRSKATISSLAAGLVVLFTLFCLWFRHTVECRILLGTPDQRAELCRTIPKIARFRQNWALQRLLRDPDSTVRSSAIAAVQQGAHCQEAPQLIMTMATDAQQPKEVRAKAGRYLLDSRHSAYLDFVEQHVDDKTFRTMFPGIASAWLCLDLDRASEQQLQNLFAMALDSQEPTNHELAEAIRDHLPSFQKIRPWLVTQLEQSLPLAKRRLVLQTLKTIDGRMRGVAAADWQTEVVEKSSAVKGHVIEAEWASQIKPNYQIEHLHGVRCLSLTEGAGGLITWLGAENGSVDIGTARFSLFAPEKGAYTVWVKTYLDDKCGNSFGFHMDNIGFANFHDKTNVLAKWHWLPLLQEGKQEIQLDKGFHQVRLKAWEDAVYFDKFALLPPGSKPEDVENSALEYWDPTQLAGISFSFEKQSQPRGTRQRFTVWIRRNSPKMKQGILTVKLPDGFRLLSPNPTAVTFAKGNPLARSTFEIELPANIAVGEGMLTATYHETGDSKDIPDVHGEFILGGQFDWLTSGPLATDSERCKTLLNKQTVDDNELATGWSRFPLKGYDQYRRLNPELAWGALMDKYIFFCTDIEVDKDDSYTFMVNADDRAIVWCSGNPVIEMKKNGPGEGRLQEKVIKLPPGKHRIFAQLFQSEAEDVFGEDAGRHTQNRCNFKLLIRKSRHVPSPHIKGLSMGGFLQ